MLLTLKINEKSYNLGTILFYNGKFLIEINLTNPKMK